MPTFTLNTSFTEADLTSFFRTGTNIVVAKPAAGDGPPNVAWIVFRPLLDNSLVWDELYGIYCSNQEIQNGAVLTQMSATPFPASDGQIYTLLPAGFFGSPTSGGTAGTYSALNAFNNISDGPGFLTFGLYQNATVNGIESTGNAVSAAPVLFQSRADMTPFTRVYIWTQSSVKSNTVVTTVTSVQTDVLFGGDTTEISLTYDPSTGGFVNSGGGIQVDDATGRLSAVGGELPEGITLAYRLPHLC